MFLNFLEMFGKDNITPFKGKVESVIYGGFFSKIHLVDEQRLRLHIREVLGQVQAHGIEYRDELR